MLRVAVLLLLGTCAALRVDVGSRPVLRTRAAARCPLVMEAQQQGSAEPAARRVTVQIPNAELLAARDTQSQQSKMTMTSAAQVSARHARTATHPRRPPAVEQT